MTSARVRRIACWRVLRSEGWRWSMRTSTPCSLGVIGYGSASCTTCSDATASSTPPGDRGSSRTRPITIRLPSFGRRPATATAPPPQHPAADLDIAADMRTQPGNRRGDRRIRHQRRPAGGRGPHRSPARGMESLGGPGNMTDASILVIFDFDNTLIDSRISFTGLREALIDLWAGQAPLPASREDLLRLPLRDIVEGAVSAAPELSDQAWVMIEAYEAAGLEGAVAMPYARDGLMSLAARGVRRALLTNNARPATLTHLDRIGLTTLLDLVITRDDASDRKSTRLNSSHGDHSYAVF